MDPILHTKRAGSATITPDTTRTSLNGFGVFAIIVFAVVSLIVIRPLHIPIPRPFASFLRRTSKKVWLKLAGPPDPTPEDDAADSHAVDAQLGTTQTSEVKRMYLTIDHVSAPVIGVLILLATTTIGGAQVRQGIVGEDGIEPYDVLALFISLAYIAISLDATGLLRYLAFLICLKAGRKGRDANGKTLYLLLYFFFWSAGVLVGNDPVILSGTAFLVYFTRVAGISPPDAWIWAEFVAANISSAVLVSSNPTNLVIASGFDVDFITYTAYMVLPAFGSAVGGLVAMLIFFRNREGGVKEKDGEGKGGLRGLVDKVPGLGGRKKPQRNDSSIRHRGKNPTAAADSTDEPYINGNGHTQDPTPSSETASTAPITTPKKRSPLIYIPPTIIRPDVDPRAALVDKTGAIFGSIVMAATLATLVGTSVIGGVKVFEIAVPGAVLCFVRDGVADWLKWRKMRLEKEKPTDKGEEGKAEGSSKAAVEEVEAIELKTFPGSEVESEVKTSAPSTPAPAPPAAATPPATRKSKNIFRRIIRMHHRLTQIFPTVTIVLSRLPFPLLPFAFSMFILVQALAHVGFINILASGLGRVCSSGFVPTAFFISFLGIVLCNIGGTNIGATILLTKSVRSPYFDAKISHLSQGEQELILKVAQYSIAFGSNVGALGGTFAASLAGLLWLGGLRQGGISVKARQFLVWCSVVVVPSTVIGIGIIVAEVRYFHVQS